jgi:hypothetical protein
MRYVYDDGGRAAAGYKGNAGDCCVRAFAIATGRPYQEIYDRVNALAGTERNSKRKRGRSNARTGVHKNIAHRLAYNLAHEYGFWPEGLPGTRLWVPTMFIGQGCKVHLKDGELPMGRLVCNLSRHYAAVIDGVIHDTHDPQRPEDDFHWYGDDGKVTHVTHYGGRCVYGYWRFA